MVINTNLNKLEYYKLLVLITSVDILTAMEYKWEFPSKLRFAS